MFASITLGTDFDALGDHRNDRSDAELRRFLQHELEFFELDDRHSKIDREWRLARIDRVIDADDQFIASDRFDDAAGGVTVTVEQK